jgi:hypothetical protein
VNYVRRLRVAGPQVAQVAQESLVKPISFYLDSNYMDFISHWELEVSKVKGDASTGEPESVVVKRFASNQVSIGKPIIWDGSAEGLSLSSGDELRYRLKAYDAKGNVDVTVAKSISLIDPTPSSEIATPNNKNWYQLMGKSNDLVQEGIKLPSATLVRYHLDDLNSDDAISVSEGNVNARYPAGGKDNLVIERIYSAGDHESQIGIVSANGKVDQAVVPVSVDGDYFFMVGLADLTIGKNVVTGSTEQTAASRYYSDEVYNDGRLAFYLKGKIKGEYLITAQMDTGTGEIKDLFKGLHERDKEALFKRIDPDQYYPVYGDDSTIIRDVDTAGKIYVRVDKDKSQVLWGNYNSGISGNSLASHNRSLYGAKAVLATGQSVANGESRVSLTGFAAQPDTKATQDRFDATDGSLYYLRYQDLALGSAKVKKVFLNDQGLERSHVLLKEGIDYQINEYQGRIILNRPFASIGGNTGSLALNELESAELVVDYEYIPSDFSDVNDLNVGARVKGWVNDYVGIGVTHVKEEKAAGDYTLQGADITLRATEDSYLKLDYAQSEGSSVKEINQSTDGGLSFSELNDPEASKSSGKAYRVEARVGLQDISQQQGYVEGWYSLREANFASTDGDNHSTGEKKDYGAALSIQLQENLALKARVEQTDQDAQTNSKAGVQVDYTRDKLTLSGQLLAEKQSNSSDSSLDKDRTSAALQASYKFSESLSAYLRGQSVVSESNWSSDDGSIAAGISGKVTDKISYNADVSRGLGDNGSTEARVGLGYQLNDNLNLYANLNANLQSGGLDDTALTVGQRASINDKLSIYSEHQFKRDTSDRIQHINSFGSDYALTDRYSIGGSYAQNDDDSVSRKSASLYGRYSDNDQLSFSNKVEWREEEQSTGSTETQVLFTNTLQKRINEDLRFQGKADYSQTKNSEQPNDTAHYAEVDLGVAYRPVNHNKLNLLGMYSFTYNLDPLSQNNADANDEKAHIFSVEGIYELNPKWELGAKVAHKQSSFKPRVNGEWTSYSSSLGVLRLRYHMLNKWDALGEYRYLTTSDAGSKHGGLVAVERHVGKNLKVGVGYNFAKFSDDLKNEGPNDTDYDAKGWFINVVGKY